MSKSPYKQKLANVILRTLCAVGTSFVILGSGRALAAAGLPSASGVAERLGLGLAADPNAPLDVAADHMSADNKTGIASLVGNVRVRFGSVTVQCDRATYHMERGDITAEGNVKIDAADGSSWRGEMITFNHKTGEGLIGTGILKSNNFTLLNDVLIRDDMGIYHARNATLSTCKNPQECWHWSITGNARYRDQEFVEMSNAHGRLFGIPCLWAPYFYRDLNTRYGWRFMPGYSSKEGAYLKTGYVYPLLGNAQAQRELYGKTVMDLRSEYGVGVGQELTWRTDAFNQWGRLTLYYANHDEDQDAEDLNWGSPYDENRWSVALTEHLEFSPRDTFTLRGEVVSDSMFRNDYKELSVRANSQPIGLANYEHRENEWVTSVAVAGPLNSFYSGTTRLPEVRFDLLPKSVFGIDRLYYESQNSIGYFQRQPAKYGHAGWEAFRYQPGNWAYYETFRVDSAHLFRYSMPLADGVTFTPRAGWRGTYWGDSMDDDSLFRSLFEVGARLQSRYWKDYDDYRHTVIPYLDFTWAVSSLDGAYEQPYGFDRIDRIYEWRDRFRNDGFMPAEEYTGLRFGLQNILQARNEERKTYDKVFDFDMYGIWVFETQDHWVRWVHRQQPGRNPSWQDWPAHRVKEQDGLRVLGFDGTYYATKHFSLSTDVQYDPEYSTLAFWDLTARYRMGKWNTYLGYLKRNHIIYDTYWADTVKTNVLYGGFVHAWSDTFEWSLFGRWRLDDSELEEIGGFVQYNLDCISFRFMTSYLPSYETEDRHRHDSNFRVSFGAWLRAFQSAPEEDWMTWGNLTNQHLLASEEDEAEDTSAWSRY